VTFLLQSVIKKLIPNTHPLFLPDRLFVGYRLLANTCHLRDLLIGGVTNLSLPD